MTWPSLCIGDILTQDEPHFVGEIASVLRPGGRFIFITTYMPGLTSPHYWFSRLFNGVMRVRNVLIQPPFIMYYLTFLLPEVEILLHDTGSTWRYATWVSKAYGRRCGW